MGDNAVRIDKDISVLGRVLIHLVVGARSSHRVTEVRAPVDRELADGSVEVRANVEYVGRGIACAIRVAVAQIVIAEDGLGP